MRILKIKFVQFLTLSILTCFLAKVSFLLLYYHMLISITCTENWQYLTRHANRIEMMMNQFWTVLMMICCRLGLQVLLSLSIMLFPTETQRFGNWISFLSLVKKSVENYVMNCVDEDECSFLRDPQNPLPFHCFSYGWQHSATETSWSVFNATWWTERTISVILRNSDITTLRNVERVNTKYKLLSEYLCTYKCVKMFYLFLKSFRIKILD
jgi:hypothetical protein